MFRVYIFTLKGTSHAVADRECIEQIFLESYDYRFSKGETRFASTRRTGDHDAHSKLGMLNTTTAASLGVNVALTPATKVVIIVQTSVFASLAISKDVRVSEVDSGGPSEFIPKFPCVHLNGW